MKVLRESTPIKLKNTSYISSFVEQDEEDGEEASSTILVSINIVTADLYAEQVVSCD